LIIVTPSPPIIRHVGPARSLWREPKSFTSGHLARVRAARFTPEYLIGEGGRTREPVSAIGLRERSVSIGSDPEKSRGRSTLRWYAAGVCPSSGETRARRFDTVE